MATSIRSLAVAFCFGVLMATANCALAEEGALLPPPAPDGTPAESDQPKPAAETEEGETVPTAVAADEPTAAPAEAPAGAGEGAQEGEPLGDPKDERAKAEDQDKDEDDGEKEKEAAPREGDVKGAEGKEEAEPEPVVPPAPEPTPEQLEQRRKRAEDFKSLGERFFDFPVTGSTTTRYRIRSGEGAKDQDIYQLVTMDVGDKQVHRATGHFDLRFSADLDSRRTGINSDVFYNVLDTYSSALDLRLYSCYADIHRVQGIEFIRAGRQFMFETPEILQFDGLRLDTEGFFGKYDVRFSFYGGIPVHQFAPSTSEDVVAGLAAEGRPWETARMRLDWTHAADDINRHRAHHNDLLALSLWQTFRNPNIHIYGRATALDDEIRDATARVVYSKPEWRLQVSGSYQGWFQQLRRTSNEFDYFFDTLQGQEPYHRGTIIVSKGWNDHFWMEGGATARRLTGEESQFNREFDRYHVTFQIRDLPVKGLTFSLTGMRYDGHEHAPSTAQAGGDITYQWNKENRTSVGTDYSLYKFDFFAVNERDEVRGYYIKHRWRPTKWARLDAKYEFEESRTDNFHTFTASFRFDF
ncbi:MAG: hypothetical protein L6R28_09230 [Planctomycetes bacterium]|nr:hypothetical protein [Planctomycetota bacterium]